MSAIRATFLILLSILLAGCGQVVTERLTVPVGAADVSQCYVKKTIAILPFADYTYDTDEDEVVFKRNMAVMEALTDQLTAKGFRMPVYEDLIQFLVDNEYISGTATGQQSGSSQVSSLQNELQSGAWSGMMKDEIRKQIRLQERGQSKALRGMDSKSLAYIGKVFKADYIMRGRILKFSTEQENTWNPMKRGLLPVFFSGTDRAFFGVTNSDLYDSANGMAMGAALGAAVGNSLNTPYSAATTNYTNLNSLVWGGVGAGAAYLAKEGGDASQAVVHLRVWIQDPTNGEVIWTNKAEVKVAPQSIYADRNQENLFHTAVNQAVGALMDDFWMKTELSM